MVQMAVEKGRLDAGRPLTMGGHRSLAVGVAIFFLALWSLLIHSHINSWNDVSRLASVEALVEHGTWAIDNTALVAHTGDVIVINGLTYSDKPPVLTFMASGLYAVLHRFFGLQLVPRECDPHASACYCFALLCPQRPDWAYYWLTLILVGIPSAFLLALFYRIAASLGQSNALALLLTGVLGLGTLVLPYSLVFNNHIPTAACLMLGLYAALQSTWDLAHPRRWLWLAGFAAALAFTLDLVASLFLVFFLVDAVLHHRRNVWPFLIGALPPLLLMVALDWWIVGDPLPPMLHAAAYVYPTSLLNPTIGGVRTASNVPAYVFDMLVGERGFFAFTPVMLWVVVSLIAWLRDKNRRVWSRAIIVALACLSVAVYIGGFTESLGGDAYGSRWFLTMTPLLFVFAAWPTSYRTLTRWLIFGGLCVLSGYAAWQGALDPWRDVPPPIQLKVSGPISKRLPPLTSEQIAAIPHRLDVSFEDKARLLGYSIDKDTVRPGDHISVVLYWQALMAMNDDYVVFIHLINPDGTLSAQRDSPHGETLQTTRYWKPGEVFAETYEVDIPETALAPAEADLQVGLYLPDQPRLATTGGDGKALGDRVSLAPVKLLPRPGTLPNSASVNWGNQLVLLGYDLPARVIHPCETLTVTLYWQLYVPVQQDYQVFFHLTKPDGSVVATTDGFPNTQPKRTSRWGIGQVVQEVRQLVVGCSVSPGLYDIRMGIFSEGDRLPLVELAGYPQNEELLLVQVRVAKK